jgi:hypothetical protein
MGRIETSDLKRITSEPYGWKSKTFNESEMAVFSECMEKYAKKGIDSAGVVREAMFQKLLSRTPFNVPERGSSQRGW